MTGKCSIFGGPQDEGMQKDSGLALYEPWEANQRPDLFIPAPADNPEVETWRRLRASANYIALRFEHGLGRIKNQLTPYQVTNPKTGQWVLAFLVDWGPGFSTGRLVDLSPGIAEALNLQTDDVVKVEAI